jgi:hypothetical protein
MARVAFLRGPPRPAKELARSGYLVRGFPLDPIIGDSGEDSGDELSIHRSENAKSLRDGEAERITFRSSCQGLPRQGAVMSDVRDGVAGRRGPASGRRLDGVRRAVELVGGTENLLWGLRLITTSQSKVRFTSCYWSTIVSLFVGHLRRASAD